MIYLLTEKATAQQVQEMLEKYSDMIKIVVDIRRAILAGGSEMHYECEELLLDNGSEQDDLWGANWFSSDQHIDFESLINIRPRLGNRNMIIQNAEIRQKVEIVTNRFLGDVL